MSDIKIKTADRVVPMIYAYTTPGITYHDGYYYGLAEHIVGGGAVENIVLNLEGVANGFAVAGGSLDFILVSVCGNAAKLARRLNKIRGFFVD